MLPEPAPILPRHLVEGAALLPDRDAILKHLPQGGTIVEIGVALGGFSRRLIEVCRPRAFMAVDTFRLHELPEFWGRPPSTYFGTQTHAEWYAGAFAAEIGAGRMRLLEGDSAVQMESLADHSVDVVYVDGDHTREGAARDLEVAVRKIKPDGWLIVNDYILVDSLNATHPYGVIYATHDFMLRHNWAFHYLALQPYMYCDVVLRGAHIPAPLTLATAEAALLRQSNSWRITAPLRKIKQALPF